MAAYVAIQSTGVLDRVADEPFAHCPTMLGAPRRRALAAARPWPVSWEAMLKVHRHPDGTVDVLYITPDVQTSIVGATPDEWTDEAAAVPEARAAPDAPGLTAPHIPGPAVAGAAAEPGPTGSDEAAAPAAEALAEGAAFKCPQCGQVYAEPTTCTNNHPPAEAVELAPSAEAPAGAAAAVDASAGGAAPEWPDQPQPQG